MSGAPRDDAPQPGPLRGPPLVGRSPELAVLRSALERARDGLGTLTLVTGDAGIGKTRLCEELAAETRGEPVDVVFGRSVAGSGAPSYWPWIQVIRTLKRLRGESEFSESLGTGADLISVIVPEVGVDTPVLPSPSAALTRYLLFEAVGTYLANAARAKPLVVILEDLHLSDEPTIRLMASVASVVAEAPLLLIGTFRLGGRIDIEQALMELSTTDHVSRLHLEGLGRTDVGRFIEDMTGQRADPHQVAAVLERSGGNPFFLGEIVRSLDPSQDPAMSGLASTIPGGVRPVLEQRLASLDEPTIEVMRAASVLGARFDADRCAALADADEAAVRRALDRGVDEQIVEPDGEVYRFTHALFRDLLYETVPPRRRSDLHAAAAAAIESERAGALEEHLDDLAHHYHLGGPEHSAKAILYGSWAGQVALRRFAYEDAIRLLSEVLEVIERPGVSAEQRLLHVLLDLGEAQRRSGATDASLATLKRAADVARQHDDVAALARAALSYGDALESVGRVDETLLDLLEEALRDLPREDVSARVMVMARLATELYWSGSLERCADLSVEAVTLARPAGDQIALGASLIARYHALWTPDHLDERAAVADEVVALAEAERDIDLEMQGRRLRIIVGLETGDTVAAKADLDRLVEIADRYNQPRYRWWAGMCHTAWALLEGRFDDAERLSQEAFVAGGEDDNALLYHGLPMGLVRRDQGRLGEIAELIEGLTVGFASIPGLRAAAALLHAELGQRTAAQADLTRFGSEGFSSVARDRLWLPTMAMLAETCGVLGDTALASAIYSRLLPFASRFVVVGPSVAVLGPVAYHLGLLAETLGDWNDATQRYRTAIEMTDPIGAVVWATRARLGLGRSLLARGDEGDVDEATALLAGVERTAASLGMTPVGEDASGHLARARGVDPQLRTSLASVIASDRPGLEEIKRLARIAEFRDDQTGVHLARMSAYSQRIGQASGMSDEEAGRLYHAAHLHDIGKIAVPDNVLLKRGPLTPEEWEIMRAHTTMGAQMLAGGSSPTMDMARSIALTHHERWDGSGYPRGVAGDAIPLVGRICALSDAFDAITSRRPYKEPVDPEEALGRILSDAGTHFDPELVELFEETFADLLRIYQRFSGDAADLAVDDPDVAGPGRVGWGSAS